MLVYLSLINTEEEKSKFEQLYNKYKYLMFYVSKNILNDDYLAEDAVHEAFIKIAENMDKLSEVLCPQTKSYVVIIVRNISLNMLKKGNNTVDICDFEDIADEIDLEDDVLSKLTFDLLVDEIANLPLIYKDVLYLTYVSDLNTKEISELFDISAETVKKRLQRGRKKLVEYLKEEAI